MIGFERRRFAAVFRIDDDGKVPDGLEFGVEAEIREANLCAICSSKI